FRFTSASSRDPSKNLQSWNHAPKIAATPKSQMSLFHPLESAKTIVLPTSNPKFWTLRYGPFDFEPFALDVFSFSPSSSKQLQSSFDRPPTKALSVHDPLARASKVETVSFLVFQIFVWD